MKRLALRLAVPVMGCGAVIPRGAQASHAPPESFPERLAANVAAHVMETPLLAIFLVFFVALVAALVVMRLVYAHRLTLRERELRALEARLAAREAALDGPGAGMIALVPDPSGGDPLLLHASPPVAALLGAEGGAPDSLAALAEYLVDGAEAKFMIAVRALVSGGQDFTFEAGIRGGARRLRLSGARPASRETQQAVPVLAPALASAPAPATIVMVDITAESDARSSAGEEARARRQENGTLRAALDLMTVPFWYRDGALGIGFANRAATLVDPGSESGRETAHRARRLGGLFSESRLVVIDGRRCLFEVSETPGPGSGSGDSGTVGWALDVTALEETQGEISRHIAAHEDVLEGLSTAIAIFGPDRRLKFFNSAFAGLWRVDPARLDADPTITEFLELLRELRLLPEQSDFRAYRDHWNGLFTRLIDPVEELIFLPDNRTLRMAVMPHPFGGLLLTFEDVTDRLALERKYNTLNEVQRETIDNLAEGVAVFGADGRMTLSNPIFLGMWELEQGFHEKSPHVADVLEAMRPLFPPSGEEDWAAYKQEFAARFADREAGQGRIERPGGTALDYAFVPLPDGATLVNFLDVTDTLNVQRALQDRNEALETADRLKSDFIANVSYELRTPLNAIIGFAEMLDNGYAGDINERQQDYLKAILDSSERLSSLIGNIIDLASIEAGYLTLDRKELDVHEVVRAAVSLVEERADARIAVHIAEDVSGIEADDRRLRQILFNLMSSTLQFTGPQSHVVLKVRLDGEMVEFLVMEDGAGLPEEMRSMLFELFSGIERGSRARGPDLALPLVRRLVELHGGSLSIGPETGAPETGAPETGAPETSAAPETPGTRAGLCLLCRMPHHGAIPETEPTFANGLQHE